MYRIINMPVVLYAYKNGLLTLREKHRLRTFEKTFGPKMDEATGGWRKLYNEELHNLYSSPNIVAMTTSRRMK
jgi:hypothetical protein